MWKTTGIIIIINAQQEYRYCLLPLYNNADGSVLRSPINVTCFRITLHAPLVLAFISLIPISVKPCNHVTGSNAIVFLSNRCPSNSNNTFLPNPSREKCFDVAIITRTIFVNEFRHEIQCLKVTLLS